MNTEKLNALKERAYKTAVAHGFHEEVKPNVYYLGLVMSEAGEAINADRNGKHANIKSFYAFNVDGRRFSDSFELFIKDSMEDEIADIVIRLLDFAGLKDCNLVSFETPHAEYGIKESFTEYGLPGILFRLNSWLVEAIYKNNVDATISAVINFISDSFGVMTGSDKDLWWFVEKKMKYNKLRPMLNGKKY